MPSSMRHRDWPTLSPWLCLTKPAEMSPFGATLSKRLSTHICFSIYSNPLTLTLENFTSNNVTKNSYDKPALLYQQGTTVFPLISSVLYDESEWQSPHTFNPSHFLDKEGKFIKRDAFMPFSAGTATLSFCCFGITEILYSMIQFNALQNSSFLQVAGCVWERVWLRWSFFSFSPPSSSAFVSLLHLELQRMNWICHQLWVSPSTPHVMSCVLSVVNEEESWMIS